MDIKWKYIESDEGLIVRGDFYDISVSQILHHPTEERIENLKKELELRIRTLIK